jgi:integrase/recombinase XerD
MIEDLFTFSSVVRRQLDAPLLQEREQYLTSLLSQGVSTARLRVIASMLLHVIRLMEFECLRVVSLTDIERGTELWLKDVSSHKTHKVGPCSAYSFHFAALKWLRFHSMIEIPPKSPGPVEIISVNFRNFMATRGMGPDTVRVYASRIEPFLRWALPRRVSLSAISLRDVDEFLEIKQQEGCRPTTIGLFCTAFRLFFRYGNSCGFCDGRIAKGIRNPRIVRYNPLPKGPPWKHIRALLNSEVSTGVVDLRASAILFLFAIYGLRSSEIVKLTLDDFDWVQEIFVVRRSKRGRVQQFPLQFEVGNAILKYLQHCRPRCPCRNLFITLKPPYKPVRSSTLWTIVANRIRRSNLNLKTGTHSFRHACATELLRQGSSLKDIADFLGHRDLESVSIYAKSDLKALRKVAAFSLAGVK